MLDAKLSHFLGETHVVFGIDRFVGGNVHEAFYAVFARGHSYISRAQHIVAEGFRWIQFEQAYMFVRGSVENNAGPLGAKQIVDKISSRPITQQRLERQGREEFMQFPVDIEE